MQRIISYHAHLEGEGSAEMSSITPSEKHSVMAPFVSGGAKGMAGEFPGACGHRNHGAQYQCRRALIVVIAFVLAALL